MQDQGKRLLLAVGLMLGVLLLWQKIFQTEPPKDQNGSGAGSGSSAGSAFVVPSGPKPVSPVAFSSTLPATPGQKLELAFPKFTATFSSTDGTLVGWHLTDKRYEGDATHGDLVPAEAPDLVVGFTKDSTYTIPKHAQWTGTKTSEHQVVYKLSTDELDITKTFDIVPEAFVVRLTVAVAPKLGAGKAAREDLTLSTFQVQDPKDDGGGSSSRIQARIWSSSTMRNGSIVTTPVKDVIAHPRLEHNIQWTGFEHPYLLVGFAPQPGTPVDKHTYADDKGLMETVLVFQPVIFKDSGAPSSQQVVAFLGPKSLYQLRDADAAAGFQTGFVTTIDLGWFGFISKWLLWLLIQLHGIFGNWGVAIIMLTVVVKLATLYWTTKSMRSMKEMAVLSPQLKVIQEKYKDDKQRQQTEMWALYKENGVSPVAGCLPMFLQMPIWIALYRTLEYAGELYRQPFISSWLPDLTVADPTHALTYVLVVAMFGQARLNPQNPDPSQKTQQMLMQYGLPIMFGAMSWVFPSGLSLYMLTNTCLQALNSVYVNKFDKKNMALSKKIRENQVAAAEAKKAKNANPSKDAKPEKPEKPDKPEPPAKVVDAEAPVAVASKPPVRGQSQKKKKGRR
ncbi:MAG TPA: membrane protein insertase YidC [Kofleriaceae bacterium]|jgi:YidC/Oxa1 family membrane protein insertase